MYQMLEIADSNWLRFALPETRLPRQEVAGLLRHCTEYGLTEHALLIVNQYPKNLTESLIRFLELSVLDRRPPVRPAGISSS